MLISVRRNEPLLEGGVKNEPRPAGFIFVSALLTERVAFKIETDSHKFTT